MNSFSKKTLLLSIGSISNIRIRKSSFLLYSVLLLLSACFTSYRLLAQTVVFSDDFNASCFGSCEATGWTTPIYSGTSQLYSLRRLAGAYGYGPNSTHHTAFYSSYQTATAWFFTPAFNVVSGKTYVVKRTHRVWDQRSTLDSIRVHMGTAAASGSMTDIIHRQVLPASYETESFEFTANSTGPLFLGFEHVGYNGTDGYNMDDFIISELPSCIAPIDLSTTVLSTSSIKLDWIHDSRNATNNYVVEYGVAGFNLGSGTQATLSDTTFTVGGLSDDTSYDFYVHADCGGGDLSVAIKLTATTLHFPKSIPFAENFNGTSYSEIPTHWSRYDLNNDYTSSNNNRRFGTSNGSWNYSGNSTGALYVSPTSYTNIPLNDWIISPRLNLEEGKTYQLEFRYLSTPGSSTRAKSYLKFMLGTLSNPDSMHIELGDLQILGRQTSRTVQVVFTAPDYDNYHVGLHAHHLSYGLCTNVVIDDFKLAEVSPTVTGPIDNTGLGLCESASTSYPVNGEGYHVIRDGNNLVALVNPNGNDLGTISADAADLSSVGTAQGLSLLSRNFNLTPSNGSGPYTTNGGVKVMIPFTNAELVQLNASVSGGMQTWTDLIISHYEDTSGNSEDCDPSNNAPSGYSTLVVTDVIPYGTDAHLLEFTTQAFSEFTAGFAAPLPVELTSFNAFAKTDHIAIEWTTASEIDASHFEVERSADGIEFKILKEVAAAGAGAYTIKDGTPYSGSTGYYRLRSVDIDGTYSLSHVIALNAQHETANVDAISVYPNPITDEMSLSFRTSTKAPVTLRITDASGRVVIENTRSPSIGKQHRLIDMSSLPAGLYAISLSDGFGIPQVRRIVKQ